MFAFLTFLSISCLKRFTEIKSKNFITNKLNRPYQFKHKNLIFYLSILCIFFSSIILFYYFNSAEAYKLYNINIKNVLLLSLMYLFWGLTTNYNFYNEKKIIDPTSYFLKDKITILSIMISFIIYYVISK